MLQCIHGVTPHYADRLAETFGTWSSLMSYLNREEHQKLAFLPKHIQKALKFFCMHA